jgi:hypothetical protein
MTVGIVENTVPKELPDAITDLLKMAASSNTIRTYQFAALQGIVEPDYLELALIIAFYRSSHLSASTDRICCFIRWVFALSF